VVIPNDRTVVLTNVPDEKLDAFLSGGRKTQLTGEMLSMVRTIDKNQLWMALILDDVQRQKMAEELAIYEPDVPPEFKGAMDAVKEARGLAISGGLVSNQIQLSIGIHCANAKHAQDLVGAGQKLFDEHVKKEADKLLADLPPSLQPVVKELVQNTRLTRQNNMAQVSLQVGLQPIETFVKDMQANPGIVMRPQPVRPVTPPDVNEAREKPEVLRVTNQARTQAKLPALKPNAKLDEAARFYAQKMAREDLRIVDTQEIGDFLQKNGYRYQIVNANAVSGQGITGKLAGDSFLQGATRKTVLDKRFTETGIGIVKDAKGEVYFVQVYAAPQ
jgi:uncharacterized protein YkwD